jgi:hypothetical protein
MGDSIATPPRGEPTLDGLMASRALGRRCWSRAPQSSCIIFWNGTTRRSSSSAVTKPRPVTVPLTLRVDVPQFDPDDLDGLGPKTDLKAVKLMVAQVAMSGTTGVDIAAQRG